MKNLYTFKLPYKGKLLTKNYLRGFEELENRMLAVIKATFLISDRRCVLQYALRREISIDSMTEVIMTAATEGLSADEIALYDRQLRLWGIEAQNRMRRANILLITIRALGNEIAKNLVLAGIGCLTVLDADTVSQAEVASEFFVTDEDIGRNVCLNRMFGYPANLAE